MRLTQNHRLFWQAKQRNPKWVTRLYASEGRQGGTRERLIKLLHACINDHDERQPRTKWTEAQHRAQATLILIRSVRRRGDDLRSYLEYLTRTEQHKFIAHRLLRRLNRGC